MKETSRGISIVTPTVDLQFNQLKKGTSFYGLEPLKREVEPLDGREGGPWFPSGLRD